MVQEERDCAAILQQMSAARSALHQASLVLARAYAQRCLIDGDRGDIDAVLDQLMSTFRSWSKVMSPDTFLLIGLAIWLVLILSGRGAERPTTHAGPVWAGPLNRVNDEATTGMTPKKRVHKSLGGILKWVCYGVW